MGQHFAIFIKYFKNDIEAIFGWYVDNISMKFAIFIKYYKNDIEAIFGWNVENISMILG